MNFILFFFLITLFVIFFVMYIISMNVLYFLATWKLFQKAGRKAWESIIPFYNIIITLKIIHRPWWWIFIVFIPIVGPIMGMVILVDFIRHYNRRSLLDALLAIFFSIFYIAYLNYSPQTQYIGQEERQKSSRTSILLTIFLIIFMQFIWLKIVNPMAIYNEIREIREERNNFEYNY